MGRFIKCVLVVAIVWAGECAMSSNPDGKRQESFLERPLTTVIRVRRGGNELTDQPISALMRVRRGRYDRPISSLIRMRKTDYDRSLGAIMRFRRADFRSPLNTMMRFRRADGDWQRLVDAYEKRTENGQHKSLAAIRRWYRK